MIVARTDTPSSSHHTKPNHAGHTHARVATSVDKWKSGRGRTHSSFCSLVTKDFQEDCALARIVCCDALVLP